jgi:hypothetical protein
VKFNLEIVDRGIRGHPNHRRGVLTAFIASVALLASMNIHAGEMDRPDLEGTWLGKLITFDDPRWSIEDILCDRWCTLEQLKYIGDLLSDPANDDSNLTEIQEQAGQFNREYIAGLLTGRAKEQSAQYDQSEDPVNACEPVGFFIQSAGQPLPFKIEQSDDQVVIRYEYWDAVRTIYTDGRNHPQDLAPSLYGHSIGWYDGPTLVIETRGIEPKLYAVLDVNGLTSTEQAISIERYTVTPDRNQLDGIVTIIDPRMLRQPLVSKASFLSFPGMEFQKFECKAVSGEF